MDSSNSGSFQSSSGGAGGGPDNDEYDSRTQSISSFFNPPTNFNPNLNQLLQPPPPPPSSSSYPNNHHNHRPSPADNTFYNPSSTQPFSTLQQPASASAWTAPIPPEQTLADFGSYPINPNPASGRGSDHHRHPIGVTVKNPKKRTRASRRAPTTVLTTDTTNFRQMVQEFTGIPSAPFSTASFSRRLDLFGRGSDGGGGSLQALRPAVAAKVQAPAPPFLNSTANIVESGTSNNNTPAATTSGNYQFAPSAITDFQKQPSTFLDLQNPMFSFQSLLQNTLPQQSNDFSGSSKRYGKLETFEGVIGNSENIGGSKLNSGLENVLVSSSRTRSGGDQVQGNEGSWICPSN